MSQPDELMRARDHLANERTFLAWVRTGLAVVVFGFAIGRFAIAIREFAQAQGHPLPTAGLSVWFGMVAIVTGIVLAFAGLIRYRNTRAQLESGRFEPAGPSSISWRFLPWCSASLWRRIWYTPSKICADSLWQLIRRNN